MPITKELLVGFAFCFGSLCIVIGLPIAQHIEYKIDCKRYGKEVADEIARRR